VYFGSQLSSRGLLCCLRVQSCIRKSSCSEQLIPVYQTTRRHTLQDYIAIFITSELQSEVHTLQFNFRTCYSPISAELLSQRPCLIRKQLFEFNFFEILTSLFQCPPFPSPSSHYNIRKRLLLWFYPFAVFTSHDKRVPVTTEWLVLTLRMEERPPLWRVAANMLKKSRGQSTRGDHPTRFLGEMLTTPHSKKLLCYKTFLEVSD